MALRVNTGGLKEIGTAEPEHDPEFSDRIDKAFEKARKRKKRNRIIIAVVLIVMLGVYLLRFY